jgi:hypothetical protein
MSYCSLAYTPILDNPISIVVATAVVRTTSKLAVHISTRRTQTVKRTRVLSLKMMESPNRENEIFERIQNYHYKETYIIEEFVHGDWSCTLYGY